MRILFDCRTLQIYPFSQPGFSGGTEEVVKRIISGLAGRGHQVHVVAPDLGHNEQRDENEFWWAPTNHPTWADVVVAVQNPSFLEGYVAPHFVLLTTESAPWLGEDGSMGSRFAAVPCMSETHKSLLCKTRPSIDPEKCIVTGLGIEQDDYYESSKVPGRMFFANDPARGLWHLLEIFDRVRRQVPEATLHVGYDFDRQFENHRWRSDAMAERMWQCRERINRGGGIVNLGALTHEAMVHEQLECQVHVHPSDPPNQGSQTYGLTQMECAAAGAALVLSDIEAFPELFGECASILPLPGTMAARSEAGELQRVTYDDWADEVVSLMQEDHEKWQMASAKSREVAARHTWPAVIDRWEGMLDGLD